MIQFSESPLRDDWRFDWLRMWLAETAKTNGVAVINKPLVPANLTALAPLQQLATVPLLKPGEYAFRSSIVIVPHLALDEATINILHLDSLPLAWVHINVLMYSSLLIYSISARPMHVVQDHSSMMKLCNFTAKVKLCTLSYWNIVMKEIWDIVMMKILRVCCNAVLKEANSKAFLSLKAHEVENMKQILLSIFGKNLNKWYAVAPIVLPEVAPNESKELRPGLIQQRLIQPDSRATNANSFAINIALPIRPASKL